MNFANAACAGAPLEWFFPEENPSSSHAYDAARTICAGCPIKDECLAWAMNNEGWESFGMYGGMSPMERNRLRRTTTREMCKKGLHRLSGTNLIRQANGTGLCRACRAASERKRYSTNEAERERRISAAKQRYNERRAAQRRANRIICEHGQEKFRCHDCLSQAATERNLRRWRKEAS